MTVKTVRQFTHMARWAVKKAGDTGNFSRTVRR